ncbi:MAG: HD domain-containing protein, partial [Bacteroidota bacterium]
SLQEDVFCYVIPCQLRSVRSKDLDKQSMELGYIPVRANDQYPGAKKLENAFFREVVKHKGLDVELLKSVLELIKWYHGSDYRQSGEPFYLHPLEVAKIVLDQRPQESTVLAALLHDTVEDTVLLLEDIEAVFGSQTADIVDNVTKLEGRPKTFYKVKLTAEESVMMLENSGNDEAMLVKLADRLHNMRTIGAKSVASQMRIAQETLQYYVPQAERLQLSKITRELKSICKEILAKNQPSNAQ